MKFPDISQLGAIEIEGAGRFLVLMVKDDVAHQLEDRLRENDDMPSLEGYRRLAADAIVYCARGHSKDGLGSAQVTPIKKPPQAS